MGLKNVQTRCETIKTARGDFTVRGLTAEEVINLFLTKAAPVLRDGGGAFERWAQLLSRGGRNPQVSLKDGAAIMYGLLGIAPDLVAGAIALAAGDGSPSDEKAARGLAFGTQIMAIEAIVRLTFEDNQTLVDVVSRVAGGRFGPSPITPAPAGLQ